MSEVELIRDFETLGASSNIRPVKSKKESSIEKSPKSSGYSFLDIKYCIDFSLAMFALIVLMPMILLVSFGLLVTQGGPILISHRRIGRNGVTFPCFKFRTMVPNGDEVLERHFSSNPEARVEWNQTRKLRDDPRITSFGRSLRRSSVDEIPQLLNVIRGEMSLVGPRPITQSEVEFYGPHFDDYVSVRPGLTGPWQVSGRSNTGYRERVEIDARYVAERSLMGDFVIMAKTVPAVLSSRGSY